VHPSRHMIVRMIGNAFRIIAPPKNYWDPAYALSPMAFPETVVNQGYPPEKWRNPSDAEVFDGDVN